MKRNEAETRADLIDPKIESSGWGKLENTRVRREYPINIGKLKPGSIRDSILSADYVLVKDNKKLAVIEAKKSCLNITEGIAQAKLYAEKLKILKSYSTNGNKIYEINYKINNKDQMYISSEGYVDKFDTPQTLWDNNFKDQNTWMDRFDNVPLEPFKGEKEPRYYQDVAIDKTLNAISIGKKRILLNLATGTGKTVIAFHIAWKLFKSKWNLQKNLERYPRILFLADRNILANQALNSFGAFDDNALLRIKPGDIKKKGSVPTNASIFFTIFQSFMSGPNDQEYYGEYPKDFFDLIIIDECHRGGANDESSWRDILNYFSPAVQIGLTATPKRKINADSYSYFGEPIFIYSLKEGIDDGFLTPFRVERIQTDKDAYEPEIDDMVVQGEPEKGKTYTEQDFNTKIKIKQREIKRIKLMFEKISHKEKTLIFCRNQEHAADIRDYINQLSINPSPGYCVRVTSDDGELGETYLRQFQENDKTIPTILTTSHKLSTGVDALNIRNIILMRPINDMIEFKQIIGRGTRLYEDKSYFTVVDFVGASSMFTDPEWDGEPISPDTPISPDRPDIIDGGSEIDDDEEITPKEKIIIELAPGKELKIKSMTTTIFMFDNKPVTSKEFIQKLFNTIKIPTFFKNEEELRSIWSSPITRSKLLENLKYKGFTTNDLKSIQNLIEAEDSDLFDVLEYIAYSKKPIPRIKRAEVAEKKIYNNLSENQKEFLDFVLSRYVEGGVEELDLSRLPNLILLKYKSLDDGQKILGDAESIKKTFIEFQKHLY